MRGEAGIDDVLHQQDVLVLNRMVQVLRDTDQAWSSVTGGAGKTGDGEEVDFNGDLDSARQCCQKKYRTLQHSYELEVASRVFRADFRGHLADAAIDLVFGEQNPLDSGRRDRSAHDSRSPYFCTRSRKSF